MIHFNVCSVRNNVNLLLTKRHFSDALKGVSRNEIRFSPSARHMIDRFQLDVAKINGTGKRGLILKEDVLHFLSEGKSTPNVSQVVSPKQEKLTFVAPSPTMFANPKANIPHIYLSSDILIDDLLKVQTALNSSNQTKLSLTDFVVKACTIAIQEFPAFNFSWVNEQMQARRSIDITVASLVNSALKAATITNADSKGLLSIAEDTQKASGANSFGALTVYNFAESAFGVDNFAEVIKPSQTAALTVGKMKKKVVVNSDGKPTVGHVVDVTLSCDQRVVDADTAARYLETVKKLLSSPQLLITE